MVSNILKSSERAIWSSLHALQPTFGRTGPMVHSKLFFEWTKPFKDKNTKLSNHMTLGRVHRTFLHFKRYLFLLACKNLHGLLIFAEVQRRFRTFLFIYLCILFISYAANIYGTKNFLLRSRR